MENKIYRIFSLLKFSNKIWRQVVPSTANFKQTNKSDWIGEWSLARFLQKICYCRSQWAPGIASVQWQYVVILFFIDFSRNQWRYMTSLTGGEMRDNCVNEIFFYHLTHKCWVLPHLAQPSFATPYLFMQPLKVATSNLLYNLCSGSSIPKQLFEPKLAGVWARGAPENFRTPTYFCNNFSWGLQMSWSNVA